MKDLPVLERNYNINEVQPSETDKMTQRKPDKFLQSAHPLKTTLSLVLKWGEKNFRDVILIMEYWIPHVKVHTSTKIEPASEGSNLLS